MDYRGVAAGAGGAGQGTESFEALLYERLDAILDEYLGAFGGSA